LTDLFFAMDRGVSRRLGLLPPLVHPKDEFTAGYFAFFVPVMILTVLLWLVFRLSRGSALTNAFLQSGSEFAALVGAPVSWLCVLAASGSGPLQSLVSAPQFYEVAVVLFLWAACSVVDGPALARVFPIVIALHFGYWFWQFGLRPSFGGYSGPLAPFIGLTAIVTGFIYTRQLRHQNPLADC